jgi:hypothetical protein
MPESEQDTIATKEHILTQARRGSKKYIVFCYIDTMRLF